VLQAYQEVLTHPAAQFRALSIVFHISCTRSSRVATSSLLQHLVHHLVRHALVQVQRILQSENRLRLQSSCHDQEDRATAAASAVTLSAALAERAPPLRAVGATHVVWFRMMRSVPGAHQ
jgi:hypothetical protein